MCDGKIDNINDDLERTVASSRGSVMPLSSILGIMDDDVDEPCSSIFERYTDFLDFGGGRGTTNSNQESSDEIKVDVKVRYPTRAPFLRYMEKLVAPKSNLDRPLLEKRPAPTYLVESWPTSNTFTMIKHERIKELKRQANDRRQGELVRCRKPGNVAQKIPREFRQRFTAHNNLKELIFEENLKEIHSHGRLFGPSNITLQPAYKHNVTLLEQTDSVHEGIGDSNQLQVEQGAVSSGDSGTSKPTDSYSFESSQKDSLFDEAISRDDAQHRMSTAGSMVGVSVGLMSPMTPARNTDNSSDTFDKINSFINDRRKVCMVNLAVRTKEGEIDRLNKMLEAESAFLAKEEKELIQRHDEHDRYLKSICQRTAEAIKKAETETHARNLITDRIKRTRYKLAHMNAECIKLEEEFLRLSTYKDFLDTVAKTLEESRAADQRVALQFAAGLAPHVAANEMHPDPLEDAKAPNTDVAKHIDGATAINNFFRSPQDLVDILAELESNNLTLIENVQEQEEACERLRVKAAKLQRVLNVERNTVDEHINREEAMISSLSREITDMEISKEQINEFTLLERYEKVFSLGSIDQFDLPWLRDMKTKRPLEDEVEKPTVLQLLDILHDQVHKLYCKIFGGEGGARLDTLLMLKILETTIDDLSRSLSGYSRNQVLKAKKTVDEHNRFQARQRQKELEALAHEAKLKRAIEKSKEPPRWHRGRRIIDRSNPPEEEQQSRTRDVQREMSVVEDADADLFRF